MPDVQEVFRMATQKVRPDPGAMERQDRNQRQRRTRQRVGGYALLAILLIAGVVIGVVATRPREERPAGQRQQEAPTAELATKPYFLDLNTGEITPLPDSIIESVGSARARSPSIPAGEPGQYAPSPDGSKIAYVGIAADGSRQIFTAAIDGKGVRQMTSSPGGAHEPTWSPDGTRIGYVAYTSRAPAGPFTHLFVLDVRTGESAQVTHGARTASEIQFTPDGESIIYMDGPSPSDPRVWMVPVTGGRPTLFLGQGKGSEDAWNASLSPDGSLVTWLGTEVGQPGQTGSFVAGQPGLGRLVANADGTDPQAIPGFVGNPAGTWSPDGSRIVCLGTSGERVVVVDIATGKATPVADGSGAIWLDDHSLLVSP
jgi:Tol biopolymer transport system component